MVPSNNIMVSPIVLCVCLLVFAFEVGKHLVVESTVGVTVNQDQTIKEGWHKTYHKKESYICPVLLLLCAKWKAVN